MELVYGDDDYEGLQRYFESRRDNYSYYPKSTQERIEEYIVERWEDDERDKTSNRRETLNRISAILEEVSPIIEKPSTS